MNKKIYIQNLSVISAFAVVVLHTNGVFWDFSYARYWLTANIIESIFYFAVPIFFMITGVTLINYNERYSTKSFLMKRMKKTVIPFILWSFIALAYRYYNGRLHGWTWRTVVNGVVNTQINSFYWFFIPLFTIYLSIPLLAVIPEERKKSIFGYIIVLAFSFNSLFPFIFSLLDLQYNNELNIPVLSGYLFYILIGYWIDNYEIKKNQRILIYLLGLVGLVVHVLGTWQISYEIGDVSRFYKGYLNVPCILYSVAIFTLFKYSKNDVQVFLGKVTNFFSSSIFGVYLTHWFVIQFIIDFTDIPRKSIVYRTIGAVIIFIFCTMVVKLIQRIPVLKYLIPK